MGSGTSRSCQQPHDCERHAKEHCCVAKLGQVCELPSSPSGGPRTAAGPQVPVSGLFKPPSNCSSKLVRLGSGTRFRCQDNPHAMHFQFELFMVHVCGAAGRLARVEWAIQESILILIDLWKLERPTCTKQQSSILNSRCCKCH